MRSRRVVRVIQARRRIDSRDADVRSRLPSSMAAVHLVAEADARERETLREGLVDRTRLDRAGPEDGSLEHANCLEAEAGEAADRALLEARPVFVEERLARRSCEPE